MYLRSQVIDNNDGVVVERVKWARGISDNDGGVGRGQRIHDASEGSETTTEALSIQGNNRGCGVAIKGLRN